MSVTEPSIAIYTTRPCTLISITHLVSTGICATILRNACIVIDRPSTLQCPYCERHVHGNLVLRSELMSATVNVRACVQINQRGEVVSEATYRLNMIRRRGTVPQSSRPRHEARKPDFVCRVCICIILTFYAAFHSRPLYALYSVRPSVRLYICMSVRLSVRPSACLYGLQFKNALLKEV